MDRNNKKEQLKKIEVHILGAKKPDSTNELICYDVNQFSKEQDKIIRFIVPTQLLNE